GADARHVMQPPRFRQPALDEARRRAHRPDRVRGTRPDADLVEVEGADGHAIILRRPPAAARPAARWRVLAESDAMPLILYQRDDCHLCDLALAVLAGMRAPAFDSVFIDGDDAL